MAGNKQTPFPQYIKDITVTYLGHMNREKKNLQSTKLQAQQFDQQPTSPTTKTFEIMSKIIPFTAKEMVDGDLKGAFPFTSTRWHKYIYLMYNYDANAILVHPLKARQVAEITAVWTNLHNCLTKHGHVVTHFILDNEISGTINKTFIKNDITFQAVPPHTHQSNSAERAIQTFKKHFLSGLATCDPEFPITEWDRLLQQYEMILNLMPTLRTNPNLSAFTYGTWREYMITIKYR